MKFNRVINMLLVAFVSALSFVMSGCGNEEPTANTGEETSRTDLPTVEKDNDTEETGMDGAETFPKTDHLFKDENIFTEFCGSGGKQTIVYNFHSQPYFSFAIAKDLLTKDADGKTKVARTDLDNNPSYCIFPPTDLEYFQPGDAVNSNNYLYNTDFLRSLKEIGVSIINVGHADRSLSVTVGKDEWLNAEINYAAHTITFEAKPNTTSKERIMTFVLFDTYNLAFPTEYLSNAIHIIQDVK